MNLKTAMADAILRAILARPLLSLVEDASIPTELWESAYAYEKARAIYRATRGTREWEILWCKQDAAKARYYEVLRKFSDVLPEILKNSDTENE